MAKIEYDKLIEIAYASQSGRAAVVEPLFCMGMYAHLAITGDERELVANTLQAKLALEGVDSVWSAEGTRAEFTAPVTGAPHEYAEKAHDEALSNMLSYVRNTIEDII